MEPPPLKLVMVQGPRQGKTLDFRPGSIIRIGRVVRGNIIAIKDAGVSSKHFSIKSSLSSGSGKWILHDLDSSNGTILNATKVLPDTPYDLHDGDCIKIGEYTSVLVQIGGHNESQVRRNPRRRATEKDAVEPVPENRGRRCKVSKETVNRRRGRQRNEEPGASEPILETIPESSAVERGEIKGKKTWGGGRRRGRRNLSESAVTREELDLEKIKLGEWFDYMEVQLPKQIIDTTEGMIEGIRRKAERVREYTVQQRNEKAKVLVE